MLAHNLLIGCLWLLLLVSATLGLIVYVISSLSGTVSWTDLFGVLVISLASLCGVVLVMYLVNVCTPGVRILLNNPDRLTLMGVSQEFVNALKQQREFPRSPAFDDFRARPPLAHAVAELVDERFPIEEDARLALDRATQQALELNQSHVGSLHLLYGLRAALPSPAALLLQGAGVELEPLLAELRKGESVKAPPASPSELAITPLVRRAFRQAAIHARDLSGSGAGSVDLLQALLDEREGQNASDAVAFLANARIKASALTPCP